MKILAIAALAVLSSAAHAQETLNYTGSQMIGSYAGDFNEVVPTLDVTSISGDIVLAQALNPNAANQVVTPVSFNFGGPLLNSTFDYVSPVTPNTFSFSTKNGIVVGWSISVSEQTTGGSAELTSTQNGDTYGAQEISNICFHGQPQACSEYSASNTQGGVFVDPPSLKTGGGTVQAPELDYRTASSALILLLGGVAIMRKRV